MFDLDCLGNWLGDVLGSFSRSHCIAICAFLVPANLIATSQTLLFTFWKRSPLQVLTMTAIASFYALLMISHVISWYAIGVVMTPTFILTFLGITCLVINLTAIWLKLNHTEIDTSRFLRKFAFTANLS